MKYRSQAYIYCSIEDYMQMQNLYDTVRQRAVRFFTTLNLHIGEEIQNIGVINVRERLPRRRSWMVAWRRPLPFST